MSIPASSLNIKKTVSQRVVLQLVEFWLTAAEETESQLVNEYTLLKLANVDRKVKPNKDLKTESFFLLKESKFNAFLGIEPTAIRDEYKVIITFDPATIVKELIEVSRRNRWHSSVVESIKQDVVNQPNFNNDNFIKFIVNTIELLVNDEEKVKYNHIFYPHASMDKLLHYQVGQERIFEQIKIQISQNLNLSKIIQTAIDASCDFLNLDRLLVYQLDIPLKSDLISESCQTVDTVTYEAKQENVASALYFQEEAYCNNFSQCKSKYRQGFSLVIDDVERDLNLNPCLKSLIQKFQVKAKAATPINVRGKLWGLIIAHQCSKTRQWHNRDIEFLRQMAEYIAIAIYHHQSYQQLQQQKNLLEKQVQTQAQQIKDALIAAEAASKSKHEFLGSMSHELRTPLTCVIGLSSTLLQWSSAKSAVPLSPEKQQQYLHLIQQSGKHLLALINNILEFSDVESGKHLLDIRRISLTNIARQSLQILRESAEAKDITLTSEIKLNVDREYFFADEIRLKEILFNLLNNGIKFTPEGGEVTLRVWREKRRVVFQVEDSGIGIASQEIPVLFEKFKQIENFKQRTHGGTGLGLALTKKLVELHGGSIEVESALDKGSLFTVYLPVQTPTKSEVDRDANTSLTKVSSPTIMLITEDEESATFICQLLNTIDCQVVWLMDSVMATNQIALLQPKLIVVDRDFGLVGIDRVFQAIEHTSQADRINLMVLSDREYSSSDSLSKEQQLTPGKIDDYLTKTMNPAQIVDKINRWLKTSQEEE